MVIVKQLLRPLGGVFVDEDKDEDVMVSVELLLKELRASVEAWARVRPWLRPSTPPAWVTRPSSPLSCRRSGRGVANLEGHSWGLELRWEWAASLDSGRRCRMRRRRRPSLEPPRAQPVSRCRTRMPPGCSRLPLRASSTSSIGSQGL